MDADDIRYYLLIFRLGECILVSANFVRAVSSAAPLINMGPRKLNLACQTIRSSGMMSALREPNGEFLILMAKLSLSCALRILFLYRMLYVFKVLASTCGAVSAPL